jgi:hypothetical protein
VNPLLNPELQTGRDWRVRRISDATLIQVGDFCQLLKPAVNLLWNDSIFVASISGSAGVPLLWLVNDVNVTHVASKLQI